MKDHPPQQAQRSSAGQNARILVVEDDAGLRGLLEEYLSQHGFDVRTEMRGDRALDAIGHAPPDVVILDLLLPGIDGMEVCRQARRHYHGAILMLTASKAEADQMLGLELGADDYVVKPVAPRILLARIRALLRRMYPPPPVEEARELRRGRLQVCRDRREAYVGESALELTSAEFDVLWALTLADSEVVSRDELHETVRGVRYNGTDRSMDVHISRLRRKLRKAGADDLVIKSARGAGYLLVEA